MHGIADLPTEEISQYYNEFVRIDVERQKQELNPCIINKEIPMGESEKILYDVKIVVEPKDVYDILVIHEEHDIFTTGQEEAIRIAIARMAARGIPIKDIERGEKFIIQYRKG